MSLSDKSERNRAIAKALDVEKRKPSEVAAQFNLSRTHVYRAAARGRQLPPEHFEAGRGAGLGGPLFGQMARTGLMRTGGSISEDYDRVFRSLHKRVKLYREMGNDPIVAAVLQAIKMSLRSVSWTVEPGGEEDADVEAAEFVEGCMEDMSLAWRDVIDQAIGGEMQYGFIPAEIVYKKRDGQDKAPASKYDDGRIGWRKFVFMLPESLSPGSEWVFDEEGGLTAINQQAAPDYRPVTIPIEKCVLFRTTAEGNNPEGRALLRGMFSAYYFMKNLQEIEAISAERIGTGFPVIYAGHDVGKGEEATSDINKLYDMVRNVRADEQMGLVIPFAKMGAGARESEGVLFELVSPTSRGIVNFHETITRYSQQVAMVGLAQFIHLGMGKIGTQALSESSTDFFLMALGAWADSLEETINRFAVEKLFKINDFPGLTGLPKIRHDKLARSSLAMVAEYINKLVGAKLITPSPEIEDYLRNMADLPKRPPEMVAEQQAEAETKQAQAETKPGPVAAPPVEARAPDTMGGMEPTGNGELEMTSAKPKQQPEQFAEIVTTLRQAMQMAQFYASQPATPSAPALTFESATFKMPDGFQMPDTPPLVIPAPVVNITMPEQQPIVIPAPVVNVAAPVVNVPAPIVNVAAPVVNVPAPLVNVSPPIIENKINLPATEEMVTIDRDEMGRMKSAKKITRRKVE